LHLDVHTSLLPGHNLPAAAAAATPMLFTEIGELASDAVARSLLR
jgi:hypothetical protein